jgi:hypothetical protein
MYPSQALSLLCPEKALSCGIVIPAFAPKEMAVRRKAWEVYLFHSS